MNAMLVLALSVALAYLLGSVSFAVVVSKLFRLSDPRTYGSKNPGATNVLRSGHKLAAALTLLLDALKGWLAVWLAVQYGSRYGIDDSGVALIAIAVLLGHMYPVYFKFVGGKGVATALGVLLALQWWLGLATLTTWIIIVLFFRISSLGAIVAALFAPFYYLLLVGVDAITLALFVIAALVLYRHRKNIAHLLAGKEPRLGRQAGVHARSKAGTPRTPGPSRKK